MGRAQIAPVVGVPGVAGDRLDVVGAEGPQQQSLRAEALAFGTWIWMRGNG
jgi:hypothetical protein